MIYFVMFSAWVMLYVSKIFKYVEYEEIEGWLIEALNWKIIIMAMKTFIIEEKEEEEEKDFWKLREEKIDNAYW